LSVDEILAMKTISLILGSILILLGGCNTRQVRVTGTVCGLDGTVKLLAELPEERGLIVLAQQNIRDGKIDLQTERLVPPAQVWIDFQGKKILELIVDSRKGTFIEGNVDSLDYLKVKGSLLMDEYKRIIKTLNEKFNPEIEKYNLTILQLSQKENLTRDDEVKIGIQQSSKQRVIGRRADYVKQLIGKNLEQDLSLFLLRNELVDSLNAQRKLFNRLAIPNKESNIYKILENQLR
jgi:hypothetical protein